MKKATVALLVALLSFTVVFAVGCGGAGESSQYNELKAQASELYNKAQEDWDALYEKIKTANKDTEQLIINAMGGNIAAIPAEDKTGLSASTRELISEADEVRAEFEALNNPEYKKYKGIDSYPLYAEAVVEAIDAYKKLLELGANFLAKLEPALASGDTAAINATIQQSMGEVTQIQEAQTTAEAALAEAQKIKETEGLDGN